MKIATLNIDWSRKKKKADMELILEGFDFDFLILTEAVELNLKNYPFRYLSNAIPKNQIYEGLNYSEYLNGETAYRTIIYSKHKSINSYPVNDDKTSLALEFETKLGNLVIYSTIIGTWFKKQPYASIELKNCLNDCEKIFSVTPNLIIVGDLNTSFLETEHEYTINSSTTKALTGLYEKLNLTNATAHIERNIDHIIIPNSIANNIVNSEIFIEKDRLSDHKGVFITLNVG